MSLLEPKSLEPAREREVTPHRVRGALFFTLGVVLMIVSPILGFVLSFAITPLGGGLVWIGLSAVATALLKRGRRHRARGATDLLEHDPRPPVLYLRSFAADGRAAEAVGTAISIRGVEFSRVKTEEEQIAMVAGKIGPLVAIGRPNEALPEAGAARMYLRDDQWQEQVQRTMDKSAVVLMRAGMTEGFWWEVGQAVERVKPERLIWLMPFSAANYTLFAEHANRLLPRALPPPPKDGRTVGSFKGWIWFEPDWTPHYETLQFSDKFLATGMPVAALMHRILAPIYRRLGHVGASLRCTGAPRIGAVTIDLVLCGVIFLSALATDSTGWISAALAVVTMYFLLLDLPGFGGTVGKRLMKVSVLGPEGESLQTGRGVARGLAKCGMVAVLPVSALVAMIVLKNSAWRRMPHDLLTSTWVIDHAQKQTLASR